MKFTIIAAVTLFFLVVVDRSEAAPTQPSQTFCCLVLRDPDCCTQVQERSAESVENLVKSVKTSGLDSRVRDLVRA